ncbi:MAG: VWA domain-containing protein [Trichodesmium sp. MAG_R02]|nr:VWA domain-containing protein [Trichodesmium sp. MAG_R02]
MALPGGEISNRPLHFIWLCDCSGSMSINGKIEALNTAIRESLPEMKRVADENPNANVLVRAVKFSDGAQWHVPTETPVNSFNWTDLTAGGLTDMGKALFLVAEQLKMPPMTDRALPPVLVLISDGQPTDDFGSGLRALMNEPWGKRAVRIAIAVGQDADKDTLQKFIDHPELRPLEANNAETLVRYIKWASTAVLKAASSPASQIGTPATSVVSNPTATTSTPVATSVPAATGAVPIPAVPTSSSGDDDVW